MGVTVGAIVHYANPLAERRHSHPPLPGERCAPGSVPSPFLANRLHWAWWSWSNGLGPRRGQSYSIIILSPIMVIVAETICPQYPFSSSSLVTEPPVFI